MKKKTLKKIRFMLQLMKRHEAYFFYDGKVLYWTYPKDGWIKGALCDGKPLIYNTDHDWEVIEMRKEKKVSVS